MKYEDLIGMQTIKIYIKQWIILNSKCANVIRTITIGNIGIYLFFVQSM